MLNIPGGKLRKKPRVSPFRRNEYGFLIADNDTVDKIIGIGTECFKCKCGLYGTAYATIYVENERVHVCYACFNYFMQMEGKLK